MAGYDRTANRLKPLVESCSFNSKQLTVINKMMRGCWALRSGDLITKYLGLMLPEGFNVVKDTDNPKIYKGFNGQEKTYYPIYILKEGESIPQKREYADLTKCQLCKTNNAQIINEDGLVICKACDGSEDES